MPHRSSEVLVNLYLDGRAQIKWHADDEPFASLFQLFI